MLASRGDFSRASHDARERGSPSNAGPNDWEFVDGRGTIPAVTHPEEISEPTEYDVAIIGGGSAGYAAARTSADAGLRTALIEGAKEIGGLCILRGCMPSKALLWAAEVRHTIRASEIWGMKPDVADFDWQRVMARKASLIQEFADYRRQQLTSGRFDFVTGNAHFDDPHTVSLSTGRKVRARNFIISTGSVIPEPPLPQLETIGAMSSDEALELPALPRSLVILGGGTVALEFAQLFRRFDVDVTLIQRSAHVLSGTDLDISTTIEDALRSEGVRLFTDTELVDARCEEKSSVVHFRQAGELHQVRGDRVLVALGRTPNTRRLGLEEIGVTMENHRIVTDSQMRSSVGHIYAAGDCTGPHDIVHIAIQQAEIAAHNIAQPERPRTMDDRLLIKVVFTDPQIATVGLTENVAKRKDIPYLTASYHFNDHGKSLIMEAKRGFVKLLADPETGEILGGACVGPCGGELIHEIVAAMHGHLTVRDLASMPHYHPTLAEIWTYPAEELAGQVGLRSVSGGTLGTSLDLPGTQAEAC